MLEKLALEYSPLVTLVAISTLALLMLGLALYFLGTIKDTWVGSVDGYKPYNTADKILIGFSLVTEYYKIEQKVDLLDLKLKDKYRDLGVLQEREIVKLVKEDSNLYLIEYEGQYFEIEKEKK